MLFCHLGVGYAKQRMQPIFYHHPACLRLCFMSSAIYRNEILWTQQGNEVERMSIEFIPCWNKRLPTRPNSAIISIQLSWRKCLQILSTLPVQLHALHMAWSNFVLVTLRGKEFWSKNVLQLSISGPAELKSQTFEAYYCYKSGSFIS